MVSEVQGQHRAVGAILGETTVKKRRKTEGTRVDALMGVASKATRASLRSAKAAEQQVVMMERKLVPALRSLSKKMPEKYGAYRDSSQSIVRASELASELVETLRELLGDF